MSAHLSRRPIRAHVMLLLFTAAGATACSDSTGVDGSNRPQFGQVITLGELQTELAGSARLEIKVLPGGLVAREIDVEPDDAEEEIASRVTAINTTEGTVTLELGGMVVSYTSATRFRTITNSNAGRAAWESFITATLNVGQKPPIEARRDPGATPQAPDNATFTAADVRAIGELDEAKIEVYVDADNFESVANPPPLAILRVFNLPIEIVAATRLQVITPDGTVPTGDVEFEARIVSVDVAAETMTLVGGTIVDVSGATFDPEGDLLTLNATASAVTGGAVVRVEGLGTVQTAGPPATIVATEVKVQVDS